MRIFTGHTAPVHALDLSPCGRYLASADEQGTIMTWDLGSSRRVNTLDAHARGRGVWALQYSKCGAVLASAGMDETVRIWDASRAHSDPSAVDEPVKPSGPVPVVASAGADALAGADEPKKGALLSTWRTKSTPVIALRFSRTNLLFAAGAFNPLGDS